MTVVWRICRAPYADLSGEGARRFGGRWNSPGRAMVYAAGPAALAALEVRVHLDLPFDLVPADYVLIGIETASASVERVATMPPDPARFGDVWLAEARSALLDVPSAIVPESANVLVNPAHPEAAGLHIVSRRPFGFDRRLWLPS